MSGTVRFTEEMTGFAWPGAATYRDGWDQGKTEAWTLMFHLTIWVDDLDAFLADPDKTAVADGWVGCPALGGRRPVERGVFNLFVPSDDPKRSNMRYRLWFRDGAGAPFTMEGHKDIEDHAGLDLWKDTTTLFTTVLRGHVDEGGDQGADVHARGILYIRPADFVTQITTFRGDARSVVRFGRLFAATLWRTYRGGLPG
jgi:cholesterol oxidase